MDLTVDQAALSRALRLVARVAPMRPTLPILQMVLLAGEPGRLRLTATDAELALTTVVPADVAREGRVAIPARLLGEYVAQLPAEAVRLALDAARPPRPGGLRLVRRQPGHGETRTSSRAADGR